MSLLILADDLTGAADCAARCWHAGLPATILLGTPAPPLPSGAVAFTSDSRHLPAAQAARRVREAITPLQSLSDVIWYKKIDSTLRGNLGSELDAMLALLTPAEASPCAVVSPAFPAQGRGLADGYLVCSHVPPRSVHLPTLLTQQTRRPVAAIPLSDVRAGVSHLAERLAAAQATGVQLLVVDALEDSDLRAVLAASRQAVPHALLCGSAGLVAVLAEAQAEKVPGEARVSEPVSSGAALIVVGSGSEMAHRQIDVLRRRSDTRVIEVRSESSAEAIGAEAGAWSGHLALHLPKPTPGTALEGPAARALAAHLATVALAVMKRMQPALLILVGGDTAMQVLDRLHVQRLTVVRELLPGMPLVRGIHTAGRGPLLVLKAGNHGDEETLETLIERFQRG